MASKKDVNFMCSSKGQTEVAHVLDKTDTSQHIKVHNCIVIRANVRREHGKDVHHL